jgi:hypothetical protein
VKSVTRLPAVVDRDLIRATEFFADLDDPSLDRIVAAAASREVRRGDVLFTEGAALTRCDRASCGCPAAVGSSHYL